MNAKALAAIVGTLSLASLATGCASTKSAEAQPAAAEKGAEGSCGAQKAEGDKGAEAGCGAQKTDGTTPAATPEKGTEHACGAGGCGKK
ncbi:hypothetical protein OWM54_34805 [Myxococcus sp. MISCRS1]|jgi:hypothetical protein|uniref:hypothetical protein n=1 Tax=Myxococcus TaxID=32 RepID=UPI001CC09DEA|nr:MULTISPECIES: hypothetical protein [unclassified Myxococcus]MBZ4398875.1 hypothetical protein [Myxococcus sp. AS-1-15]MBZ4407137.1 hypothetical protein [Myxococcus sp. XM-1-1-1]MCY1002337.1 hypothetical protein [Myxococcus sp. MISCRS1]